MKKATKGLELFFKENIKEVKVSFVEYKNEKLIRINGSNKFKKLIYRTYNRNIKKDLNLELIKLNNSKDFLAFAKDNLSLI